jgi:hypothetical protein
VASGIVVADPVRGHDLPFRLPALQGWMADQAVPEHGLEGLGQGRDPARVDLGDEDDHIAVLGAHDPEYFCRARLGQIDRVDDVGADLALGIAAADGVDQDRVLIPELTGVEPCGKDRVPSLVIGAGGEFGDVIDGAVDFDPAELAKVVDGVAAVARAPDADQGEPALALAQPVKFGGQGFNRRERKFPRDSSAQPPSGARELPRTLAISAPYLKGPRRWKLAGISGASDP